MNDYQKFKGAGYVGNKLGQGKNDYGDDVIFYGLFHAPKKKFYTQ